jgi:hypothetical protein
MPPEQKTITTDNAFVDTPVSTVNELGGDNIGEYTPPSPEERGDFIPDDEPALVEAEAEPEAEAEAVDEPEPEEEDEVEESEVEESESETETEAEEEPPEEEDDEDGARIPRSRLNKEAKKRKEAEDLNRELQRQLDELKAKQTNEEPEKTPEPPPELTIDEDAFKKMNEAMLDENPAEAMKMFKKILEDATKAIKPTTDNELSREQLKAQLKEEIYLDRQNEMLQKKAAEMAKSYPELDMNSDVADKDMIEEVVELRNFYIDKGEAFADALESAVDVVSKRYELVNRTVKKAAPATKPVDTKRKLEVAKKETGKLANDGGGKEKAIDIRRMSESEFARLSEEAKRQLRGDFV